VPLGDQPVTDLQRLDRAEAALRDAQIVASLAAQRHVETGREDMATWPASSRL
jgi:hypothetical protein